MAHINLDRPLLQSLPKVLLHEHLDGVLRPQTVIDLARDAGYSDLPTQNSEQLAQWFHEGANRGSLAKYLKGFKHTIAVMQTEDALERVAYEQAEDLSRDGVVFYETRFAPIFHTERGLSHQQAVAAVLKGMARGRKDFGLQSGLIICAMRNMNVSLEMAELAVDFRERGVVGFDLAGEEGGFPPKKHVDAFHYIQRENFNITIHAGEGFGKESIWQAIQYCGAHRIGHGTRLIDDIAVSEGRAVKLGDLAQYVLDKRIPLEICLLSNVHTGAAPTLGGASIQSSISREIPCYVKHGQPSHERHEYDERIRGGGEDIWAYTSGFRKDYDQRHEECILTLRTTLRSDL